MTLQTHYSIPSSILVQVVDDEVLLFNSANGQFFTINEVGAGMWEVMQDYTTLGDVLNELKEYFDVPLDKLTADLVIFGESLEEQQLIVCDEQ